MEWDTETSYAFEIFGGAYIMFDITSDNGVRLGITQNDTNPEFPYEIANGTPIPAHNLRELGKVIQAIADGYEGTSE